MGAMRIIDTHTHILTPETAAEVDRHVRELRTSKTPPGAWLSAH
jgi:hypothetical protein